MMTNQEIQMRLSDLALFYKLDDPSEMYQVLTGIILDVQEDQMEAMGFLREEMIDVRAENTRLMTKIMKLKGD